MRSFTVGQVRLWTLGGIRAAAAGPRLVLLSVLNLPLFVLTLAALVLLVVPGLGLVVFPAVVALVRRRTGLERRLAAQSGVSVATPYRPVPPRAGMAGWRQFRWVLTDPATWLDIAWLLPGALTGIALGLLCFGIPLYGLQGATLLPLLIHLINPAYGYGVFWPIANLAEGWLCGPQGLLILLVGLGAAPWLLWLHARFAKIFLGPSRTAELSMRVEQLTVTRADTVDAQAMELRRIERDLHDGAQARLVSLSMSIGLAEEMMTRNPAAARRLLAEAREASTAALVELRHLVRGIHPPVLAERGLDGAVRALAMALPVRTEVDIDLPGRPETPVESAAYFAVAEVLANVTRHSGARAARVILRYADDELVMVVGDDGVGGADPDRGTGLHGIERRLAAFDGTMTVSSPPGGPTVVTMELPCVLSSPKTMPSSGMA